jgi:lipoic acid synthetase
LSKKPLWLKVKFPSDENFFRVSSVLKEGKTNTICRSAMCPNISECWSRGTATFLILGDICTRNCGFCAVRKGAPLPLSEDEPSQIAETVSELCLSYAVVTSVTRDDLPDGGASHFAATIRAIKEKTPEVRIEVLIPDFNGDDRALEAVVQAAPDILNHNLETTESMYPTINRPKANYRRSLEVLQKAREIGALTKSGLMVGLGEEEREIFQSFSDLRKAGCGLLTIGQYLQPSKTHATVAKYYTPAEFRRLKRIAVGFGFREVESGPLVRSSYKAHQMYDSLREQTSGSEKCAI